MYVNKCTKCGAEFETKNPKRVICPNCLYPEKKLDGENAQSAVSVEAKQFPRSYSAGPEETPYRRPQQYHNNYRDNNRPQGGYNRDNRQQGGYNRQQQYYNGGGGYNNRPQQGGYNRDNRQQGGFNRGGYNNRPQQGGFNKNRSRGNFNKPRRPQQSKQLLISKEQLIQIEELYKKMLPLPNPDAHEVISAAIGLEPRKVFFGMNLLRQKMFLPKLPFPKRKLAVSPEQLTAIKTLYEPLLPLPPIGCHKIIAIQLKMDEWRVHVGIGIVRKQMGLDRWNEGRPDAPQQEVKETVATIEIPQVSEIQEEETTTKKVRKTRTKKVADTEQVATEQEEVKASDEVVATEKEEVVVEPKKRGRKKKTEE